MRRRLLLVPGVVAIAVLGLAACTGGGSPEAVTTSTPTSAGSTSPDPSASASTDPAVATAMPKFDAANQATASGGAEDDRAIVDALVTAGFDKGAMQITPDTTTIGRKVDSIEVSVLVGSTCLLGEFRGTTYVSETSPVLSTGKCLLGNTRAIDW